MRVTFKSEKSLTRPLKKKGGRASSGRMTVRHRGGGEKRDYREIDFRREKWGVPATVVSIEDDPNRSAGIALLVYADGEKRYILAPEGLKIGEKIISGEEVEIKIGNHLPLEKIPIGLPIHNLELVAGKGGQLVRGAGQSATLLAKKDRMAHVRLPSGEVRQVSLHCAATIGQVGNLDHKNIKLGKAGRARHLGRRPTVRGVAQHPASHPHGGGEGRSGIGMSTPKTYAGRPAVGKTRKKGKYSDKLIIERRK